MEEGSPAKVRFLLASLLCGLNQSPIDRNHTLAKMSTAMFESDFTILFQTNKSKRNTAPYRWQLITYDCFSRPHSHTGAAVPAPAAVPLRLLHPDAPRALGAARRDVGPHQHRDGHCVRLSLPERRGEGWGQREGPAGWGRVGLGAGGGVSPSAVHAAVPWAQHCRPAGYPGLCRYAAG